MAQLRTSFQAPGKSVAATTTTTMATTASVAGCGEVEEPRGRGASGLGFARGALGVLIFTRHHRMAGVWLEG